MMPIVMPRARTLLVLAWLLPVLLAGCSRVDAGQGRSGQLEVTVGEFQPRFLLTGELRAAEAVQLTVPRTTGWQVQVRWLEEDGATVEAGQTVAELDNSSFAQNLEDRRQTLEERRNELERSRAEAEAAIAEKAFNLEQKEAALAKARIDASVPEELLPTRDYQERQLALRRAEVERTKAEEELRSTRLAQDKQVELAEIDLHIAHRELETAERGIDLLSLEAPTGGILVVADHPWENRKIQIGDTVFVGLPVVRIPDLETLQVEAVLYDVDEGRIEAGQRAVVTPDAFPSMRLEGEVSAVSPVAREVEGSSQRRSFLVEIALDGADPERLRPGMSVKAEVLGEVLRDVLLAPRGALDVGASEGRAYLVGGGSRAVRLGPCNPSHCVVEEGLEAGDLLRLRPSARGVVARAR